MMTTVLHIDASVDTATSRSRAASAALVAAQSPDTVIRRDVAATALPHIDGAWAKARMRPADELTDAERETLALSDTLVSELKAADVIVIGLPVYNFGMPASLKAWVDLVARPKVTFAYTPEGPKGLLHDKRAIIAVASGGTKVGTPSDFASTHLTHVLGFLGIRDVTVIDAAEMQETQAA